MQIFKTKKIVFLVVILLIISVVIILLSSSCNINSGSIAKKGGTGAISLLDSLGVGDVPDYPGSKLDVDLYRSIESVLLSFKGLLNLMTVELQEYFRKLILQSQNLKVYLSGWQEK